VSHLGFVLLGVFAWNELALQGAVLTMVAHGLSTGALFIIVGALQHRIHTRDVSRMGGFWTVAPNMGGATTVFVMASLGIPGLADFVGEFLTLLGTWQTAPVLTVLAAVGILIGTVYGLKLLQHAFYGENVHNHAFPDLNGREVLIAGVMIVMLVAIGLYPAPVLDAFGSVTANLLARS
jgi:NADH-quinone oxidoreductase subunit M